MALDKQRGAFYKDDGEYIDDDDVDYDDGEYVDEDGVAYDDDNNDEQIKYVSNTTGRATKSSRKSTKGRQLKRWDGEFSTTHNIHKTKVRMLTKTRSRRGPASAPLLRLRLH